MTGFSSDHEQLVPLGKLLEALADPERRRLLSYLQNHDEPTATVDEIVSVLTTSGDSPTPKEVRIALIHKHLPKLANAGIIDYDARSEAIRYDGHHLIDTMLDIITRFESK